MLALNTVSGPLEREDELRAIHALIDDARRRLRGRICTVAGAAGIGKTTLLDIACSRAT